MKQDKMPRIWLILEAVIAVGVYAVWISLFFRKNVSGMLTSRGITSLRYYTVLSNLAAGAASVCCLISYFRGRKRAGAAVQRAEGAEKEQCGSISRGAFRFRFVGSVMALTTFLTVLLFFLPLFGWGRLYSGSNFWFHLIFPLLSVVGFFLIPGAGRDASGKKEAAGQLRLSLKETLLPILPVILYGAIYCINILINGRGTRPRSNDWYGFLTWGWGIGFCILGGIVLATWLAGLLLRAVCHRLHGQSRAADDQQDKK